MNGHLNYSSKAIVHEEIFFIASPFAFPSPLYSQNVSMASKLQKKNRVSCEILCWPSSFWYFVDFSSMHHCKMICAAKFNCINNCWSVIDYYVLTFYLSWLPFDSCSSVESLKIPYGPFFLILFMTWYNICFFVLNYGITWFVFLLSEVLGWKHV